MNPWMMSGGASKPAFLKTRQDVVWSLILIGVLATILAATLLPDMLAARTARRHARERFECERDVGAMRGGAGELQQCLEARGWKLGDALQAANQYYVIHRR